ncbi:MAG: serine/threonine-protein phosphatase [Actinomycetota bacterium]|nr:serine/threonine-protein phosphatase [Actinomycetota bacterium]
MQRSILPVDTFQPEELEVCARYLPGVEGTEVGGDWYDVIPLGAGRVGLVIGDVMGRGVRAAAVMGQLRTAVRAYSRLDIPPAELLGLLDGLVAELRDEQIVTCTYAVFDPATKVMTLANAGHLPPIVVRPAHRSATVPTKVGAPLGVGIGVFTEHQVSLEPGALLALYTDGLVERRAVDIESGISTLMNTLEQPIEELDDRCDAVLDRLCRADGRDDDVALLVVRIPSADAARSEVERMDVPRGIRSVRLTRRFCLALFLRWQLSRDLVDATRLVVNELVTNALLHGRGPVELVLRRTPSMLYVEVIDASGHMPRRRLASVDDEGGRGLHLVASLSQRWGVRPVGDGKSVWAALSLNGAS